MPRRCNEIAVPPEPPRKKTKALIDETPSLEVSFCDDEALQPGIVFADILKKKWRIGKPIGRGSFGRIYLASDDVDKEVTKQNARYVVKIEPHTNGPLFVEIHCLIRTAQASKVKAWCHTNKLKHLGMPMYIASGSFTDKTTDVKYRFLVLPRYDIDLQKIILRTKVLDVKNTCILAIQILDVLEFLHSQGYTHSDIKSSNLMLGFDGGKLGKVPQVQTAPAFQKENKNVAAWSRKHRRVKSGKGRSSNYYDDEDFIIDVKSPGNSDDESGSNNQLAQVKSKLRRILSDPDSRSLHRHHAFNLRQLSNCVNYEDLNSSVCSDQSYQKSLDDVSNTLIRTEDLVQRCNAQDGAVNVHKEAVMSQSNGQIYLLDYGLASKFLDAEGKHKDFGMDARKAHDGTLEYSSRDSHIGAHSRRSDLENLGYNLLDWLTATLPWKTPEVLAEPDLVHALKKNFMGDIKLLLKTCFKTEYYPQFMEKYFEYVTSLEFTETPDYEYCKSLFKSELLKGGYDKDACLNFAEAPMSPVNRSKMYSKRFGRKNSKDLLRRSGITKPYGRENVCSLENGLILELLKQTLTPSSEGIRKPCASRNFIVFDADLVSCLKKFLLTQDVLCKKLSPKNLRSNKKKMAAKRKGKRTHRNSIGKFGNFMGSAKQFTWAEILARNPEDIIRKERNVANNAEDDDDDDTCKYRIRKLSDASESSDTNLQSPLLQKDYLQDLNPTYAMKDVIANLKRRISGKNTKEEDSTKGIDGYTPAMMKLLKIKEKREAKEKADLLKQMTAVKVEVVPLPIRCTRSMRSKTIRVVEPTKRVTRNKTKSVDSVDKTVEVKDVDGKIERRSARNAKKKVSIDETPKATPRRTVKKSPPVTAPNSRRRLRSSKRIKK